MNLKLFPPLLLTLLCGSAFAAAGSITISSPANGAMVSATAQVPVVYDATLGPDGNHLHLYVDGKRVDVLRVIKGTTQLDPMGVGKHHICLTVNTVTHAPTGVESCVDVTAQ